MRQRNLPPSKRQVLERCDLGAHAGLDVTVACSTFRPMPRKLETKAIEEGIEAYCAGIALEACPYDPGTREHRDWTMGWEEAARFDRQNHPNTS